MLEMSKKITPEHMGEKHPREKILKLGKKITDVALHKIKGITTDDPEYWGLAAIVTDEQADICLKMKVRHHYTFEELVKMNNIPKEKEEQFRADLHEMCVNGLLEFDYGNHYDHYGAIPGLREKRYCLPLFVPGSAEMFNMSENPETGESDIIHKAPEVAPFFERMTYIPLAGITQLVPEGGAGIGMHVIPVEKAIEFTNESVDIEHLSYWLKKYEGKIGVGPCSCRVSRGLLDEGCADDYQAWCIGVGDFSDYCRETGRGHDISYEEAMAILKRAEDNGFVHQVTNIDGESKIFGICNCNVKICNALRTSLMFNTPNLSASAYRAQVNPKNCVACGRCVEYCPAGAVKLGQKLCTKNGPIAYPKHELPDAKFWPESKWDLNYRDNDRKESYDTGTAPCKSACPAHVAVQGYLKMASQGRYKEALALIKKENPFPAICGRVCNRRCEDACTRGTIDKAVAIDDVKKFIAEQDLNAENRYVPEIIMAASPGRLHPLDHWDQKIAIVGAGPAGLSCAYYLATIGYKPTVFEKNEKPGGMMRYGIPSYKLEKDVIDAEIDILRELGVEIKCGVEVGKDVTIQELRDQGYKAFYMAIGCQGGRYPGVENDHAEGTTIAVDFLRNSYENKTPVDGDIIVVGGGNVAVDCARVAHRLGAKSVSMYCLEDRATMPASKSEQEETLEEDITINNSWGPKELHVDENGHVTEVVFKRCLSTIDPETKKFNPVYDENETITVKADQVIFAIGQAVDWKDMLKGTKVELNRAGYPQADRKTYQTAEPDIFVGGDVFTGPKFVIDAIAQGHEASDSLHRFVHEHASMTIGKAKREFIALDKDNIVVESYDNSERQYAGIDETVDHKMSFIDVHKTLTEAQVKIETSRCLGCGASVVDENRCIGCGICTTKCEFDAIQLVRSHPHASDMRKAEEKFNYIIPYAAKRGVKILLNKDRSK